jgi:4-hydroxy-3-polyprenylbenzoate decarboxylase
MSGSDGAYHGRFVIMVDDDIDPTNENDVLWAIATRCDPKASIDVIRRCWSTPLDPTIPPWEREKINFTNSRAIIDACRPFEWIAEFPPVNKASDQIRKKIIEKWTAIFSESSPVVEMGKN